MDNENIAPNEANPQPAPAEMGGPPPSMDEIFQQAIDKATGGSDESSGPPVVEGEGSAPEAQPSETPAPDTEVTAGESETPESAEDPGAGDSPSAFTIGGQEYTEEDLGGFIEVAQNRDAFKTAAEKRVEELYRQGQLLQQTKQQLEQERQKVARDRAEAEQYARYAEWVRDGGSGNIEDFVREVPSAASAVDSGRTASKREKAPPQDIREAIREVLAEERKGSHQNDIRQNIDGWVEAAVNSEPALKARSKVYQSDIMHRLVIDADSQGVTPFDFTGAQLQGFLRQFAREAAIEERKLSETTMAERLDVAARTQEKLPAAPKTQGTPLPQQPANFQVDARKVAEESGGDSEVYWSTLTEKWKQQADELSSAAKRL